MMALFLKIGEQTWLKCDILASETDCWQQMNEQEWLEKIQSGDRLALSKAITLVESDFADHQQKARSLMAEIEKVSSSSFRLAITGVPGAGKSTLINKIGINWIEKGHKVAVLAIDPSSSLSHGSILGDKTRMTELAPNPGAFIRPSPTRLFLGGLASTSYETVRLCEAAGFDRILVETVGVGQSETLASHLCDACLLLLVTGAGDDLQGVKKGILESADFILVNKADGANLDQAKAFARELKSLRALWPDRKNGEKAEIFTGSSVQPDSLQPLWVSIDSYLKEVDEKGLLENSRRQQKAFWLEQILNRRLQQFINQNSTLQLLLNQARLDVKNPGVSVVETVEIIMNRISQSLK